jgi:hypothetical protein
VVAARTELWMQNPRRMFGSGAAATFQKYGGSDGRRIFTFDSPPNASGL